VVRSFNDTSAYRRFRCSGGGPAVGGGVAGQRGGIGAASATSHRWAVGRARCGGATGWCTGEDLGGRRTGKKKKGATGRGGRRRTLHREELEGRRM
jgi:hypothetical protein